LLNPQLVLKPAVAQQAALLLAAPLLVQQRVLAQLVQVQQQAVWVWLVHWVLQRPLALQPLFLATTTILCLYLFLHHVNL
jgi:hypothetical protein